MPRINFIPPPINFSDRGTELVAPIMSNAMRLAETFTTDIPRMRMQQEAIREEKARYGAERDYKIGRDKLGDTRYTEERDRVADQDLLKQFGGYELLMQPDAVDLDGDGQPDYNGVSSKGLTLGKMAAPKGTSGDDLKVRGMDAKDRQFELKRKDDFVNERLKLVDSVTGKPLHTVESAVAEWNKYNPPEEPANTGTYAESPFGTPEPEGVEASAAGGVQAPPSGPMSMGGTPVYSSMRRMLALQKLDQMKAIPPDRRARNGLPNDMQIDQLKMAIMNQAQGGQPGAPGQPAPAGGGAPVDESSPEMSPEPAAAPSPYPGFERTPTADNLVATKEASSSVLAALAQEASADPEVEQTSFTINANDPNGFSDRRQPLDLQAGLEGMQMMNNPNGIPDWILPFMGRAPSNLPKRMPAETLQMLQGGQVDPATGVVRFRPQSSR